MKQDGKRKSIKQKDGMYKTLMWLAGIIVVIGGANPFIIGWIFANKPAYETYKEFGPVGDWIGGSSTPLITLASFIILLAAFLAQKEELQETRKEMQLTREQMEQQSKTISRQRFENTFFQMLNLHSQIVTEFQLADGHTIYTGRHTFKRIHQLLKFKYNIVKDQWKGSDYTEIDLLQKFYYDFFVDMEEQVGHYIRNLYRIYKFIHEEELTEIEKDHYAGIVRAQLSSYEQVLLLYNGISTYGREKFLPLMLKYDTMDNLNQDLLIDERHYGIYSSLSPSTNRG